MTTIQKAIIKQLIVRLRDKYSGDTTGHDWLHLERVWKMAKRLAQGENVDMFLVETGALLHDVDDFKFRKPGDDELKNTKALLSPYKLDEETMNSIFDIVSHVSFKAEDQLSHQHLLEGKIVQDADRLDALGAIGIARTFAYNGSVGSPIYDESVKPRTVMTFDQYKTEKSNAINHFYEKLLILKDKLNTPQAKNIAEHRHTFLKNYLIEFWDEIKGER